MVQIQYPLPLNTDLLGLWSTWVTHTMINSTYIHIEVIILEFDIELIKKLRQETGFGMLSCKYALKKANTYEEAKKILKDKADMTYRFM